MDRTGEIIKRIKRNKNENKKLLLELKKAIRSKFVGCMECGKRSRLSRWTFILNFFYCHGEWNEGETRSCNMICPRCGKENSLCNPQRDKIVSFVEGYSFNKRELFKKVKREERNTGFSL